MNIEYALRGLAVGCTVKLKKWYDNSYLFKSDGVIKLGTISTWMMLEDDSGIVVELDLNQGVAFVFTSSGMWGWLDLRRLIVVDNW